MTLLFHHMFLYGRCVLEETEGNPGLQTPTQCSCIFTVILALNLLSGTFQLLTILSRLSGFKHIPSLTDTGFGISQFRSINWESEQRFREGLASRRSSPELWTSVKWRYDNSRVRPFGGVAQHLARDQKMLLNYTYTGLSVYQTPFCTRTLTPFTGIYIIKKLLLVPLSR